MNIFHVGKRVYPHHHWEPIYIGTNEEPWYDERLTWEGRADKMDQRFKLCLFKYDFYILLDLTIIVMMKCSFYAGNQTSLQL